MLQFEPNVRTIIENFCDYIKTNYDKVFADIVLLNIQEEAKFVS